MRNVCESVTSKGCNGSVIGGVASLEKILWVEVIWNSQKGERNPELASSFLLSLLIESNRGKSHRKTLAKAYKTTRSA